MHNILNYLHNIQYQKKKGMVVESDEESEEEESEDDNKESDSDFEESDKI